MLFNSISYLIFFPTVTLIYFLLPHSIRWFFLLTASCFFYLFFIPKYILILALTILVDYFAAIWIENESEQKKRNTYLVVSIVCTCLILFFFKYFNFFIVTINDLTDFLGLDSKLKIWKIILPLGLSFHTFQSLSYVIEVWRGNQKAERHFGIYALYVMFFPQLVAGPIERPQNLLHQFHEKKFFNYDRTINGLKLMCFGFIKKIIIADRLGSIVDIIYDNPSQFPAIYSFVATAFFAFQIYCDFSGYSDIARGSARILGYELMVNFNRPYLSQSVSEFWRRWHISLSTWFKDYVYVPLGGNRVSLNKQHRNILITFLLSGLWHGANWTFVIWGGLNGVFIVISRLFQNIFNFNFHGENFLLKLFLRIIKTAITFILICFTWIFFRASSVTQGIFIVEQYVKGIFDLQEIFNLKLELKDKFFGTFDFTICYFVIFALMIFEISAEHYGSVSFFEKYPKLVRWPVYALAILLFFLLGDFGEKSFIYFQF